VSAGNDPRRLVLWTIWMVALSVVILWTLYLVRSVVLLIYVSILFATGLAPLVRLLERQRLLPVGSRHLPRWVAILALYLAVLGVLTVVVLLILPPLADQAAGLWNRLPQLVDQAQQWLVEHRLLEHSVSWREAVATAPTQTTNLADLLFQAVSGVLGGLVGVVSVVILTFYLLLQGGELMAGVIRFFPRDMRPHVAAVARQIAHKVSAWLSGEVILAGTIGGSAALGLFVMQVPYFYVLALIAAAGEVIPVVGPILASIPAIAVAFTVSPKLAVAVAVYYLAQQQVENHVLVPKIMGRQVGVSPFTVLVALLAGDALLGMAGALLAVPTAAVIQVIVQEVLDFRDASAT
jgi:predicted PurR-regulated permease PerM